MTPLDSEADWFGAVASLEYCVLCRKFGVQVAHSNKDRGLGQKSKPWMTAALCQECHHEIDNGKNLPQEQRRARMDRAIVLTHSALIERGKIRLSK